MEEIIFTLENPVDRVEMFNAPVGPTKGDVNYNDPDFSNVAGVFKNTILDPKERQRRRAVKEKNKSARINVKATSAEAQKLAAKGLSTPTTQVKMPAAPKAKPGMSTGAKIGIGVGALLVVGIIAFVIIKKKKK